MAEDTIIEKGDNTYINAFYVHSSCLNYNKLNCAIFAVKCYHANPLNHIVHFWLNHTAHCAGSVSAERVGQGKVAGVTRRATCTWWLLGFAVKTPRLVPGGPFLALAAWTNATLTL